MESVTWIAQLLGDASDLEHLAAQLMQGAVTVVRDEAGYLLRSERRDGLTDIPLVVAELDRSAMVLTGLLKLLRFSKTPLTVARVRRVDARGSIVSELIQVPSSVTVSIDDGQTITVHTKS